MQEQAVNLLDQAFEQVTDQQIVAFQIKMNLQRTPALAAGASVTKGQMAPNPPTRVNCWPKHCPT
jgi:hypothetical protein